MSTLNRTQEEAIEAGRRKAFEKYGVPPAKPFWNESISFRNFSFVKFTAVAGLGHRLIRQAAAVYIGRRMGFAVRGYWSTNDYANGTKDLFTMMFDPFTRDDFAYVNSTNKWIGFNNEVPYMTNPAGRARLKTSQRLLEGPKCGCTFDEIQVHHDFYKSLRDHYSRREQLAAFMEKKNFSDHTVFGIHIRAGNGEKKDFMKKGRGIHYDPTVYVNSLITVIRETTPIDTLEKPPMIFLATDDPNYRSLIANEIHNQSLSWPVVVLEQEFAEEGVILQTVGQNDEKWHSMFQDMLLLSYSDVLIPAKYSSFTQAIPKYLVLERPYSERPLRDNYCEIIDLNDFGQAKNEGPQLNMYCYHSYMQNCCGTDNIKHRVATKFLRPSMRSEVLEFNPRDFQNTMHLSFEDSLGRR